MSNAGCRRMKRSLYIDQTSVHFMTEEEQQNSKILLLDQYLNAKQSEIDEFNKHLGSQSRYNKRRLTNIGTFRAYVEFYLRQHKGLLKIKRLLFANYNQRVKVYH